MDILKYNPANVQPVSAVYCLDPAVKFKEIREFPTDGLHLTFINALSSLENTTVNNYNNFYLSEQKEVGDILEINTPAPTYPIYRATHLKNRDSDSFWVVNGTTGITEVTGTSALADNRYYFELEILNPAHIAVRHYDGTAIKYLTLSQTNSSALTFESRDQRVDNNLEKDGQIFRYILDNDNNTLCLFNSVLSSAGKANETLVNPSCIRIYSNQLSAVSTDYFEFDANKFDPTKKSIND
jgi:hypothetical protein